MTLEASNVQPYKISTGWGVLAQSEYLSLLNELVKYIIVSMNEAYHLPLPFSYLLLGDKVICFVDLHNLYSYKVEVSYSN